MIKEITFNKEATDKLVAGVNKLANVVKTTLGPGGTNVVLQRSNTFGITKDGVSIARDIYLEDQIEEAGAQIVKEVALKTLAEAGDGTTTATVLAQAILTEGLKAATEGKNAIEVKREIDRAVVKVVAELKRMSKPVEGDDILKVALISANGDKEIGGLVAEAVGKVGLEGLVTVEDSKSYDTYVKEVPGMRWERGYMSPRFVNKPSHQECELIDPVIMIIDGNLATVREMAGGQLVNANIIKRWREDKELGGKPLLIIAHDFGVEAIATMVMNVQQGLPICLVQAPEFGDVRKMILEDIAAMTGATVISKEAGLSWDRVNTTHLGRANSVRVTQWMTTIIGGHGELRAQNRAQQIREQMKETNEHALQVLKVRLARLTNGLMVIYVGGGSEVEIQEKKDRIDDALNATRAAISEGVLPGGGVSYIRAGKVLGRKNPRRWLKWLYSQRDDMTLGESIIFTSIMEPFMSICRNVGQDPAAALATVELSDVIDYGFNASTLKYEPLIAAGVIDPTKVVRLALENAASVAGMLLTTKATVTVKPIKS